MIEWIFSGLVRLVVWLWSSAVTLYYLAGFFIVIGGLIMFVGSVVHHYWTRSLEQRISQTHSRQDRVVVHIDHLTIEVTEPQLRRILGAHELPALKPGKDLDEDTA
jgi:Uri superfamily endonuclease